MAKVPVIRQSILRDACNQTFGCMSQALTIKQFHQQ
jgi:hypothetical protein